MISVHGHARIFVVYVSVISVDFSSSSSFALPTVFFSILGTKDRGKKLSYKGCTFHRVVKNFMIQSGDYTDGKSIRLKNIPCIVSDLYVYIFLSIIQED